MNTFRLKLALGARRLLRIRTVRRLARREDGAAAVEFGFVALPFFALLFAIIEAAMVFLAGQYLESIAAASARLVLTGQAQSISADDFKTKACERIKVLFDCEANLKIDVRTFSTFNDAIDSYDDELIDKSTGELKDNFAYQPGKASEIVVVRLIYAFPVLASRLLGFTLSDMAGNKRLIVATVAFRNEPFGTTSSSGSGS